MATMGKISVYLPDALITEAKIYTIKRRKKIKGGVSALVELALREYLEAHKDDPEDRDQD